MGTRRTTHQLRAHATNILFLSITSDDNNSLRKRNSTIIRNKDCRGTAGDD